jgi:large subunit ribosomal protein L34
MCNNQRIMSFTYNPHKRKRAKTHGFLARKATTSGRNVIRRRRQKGRAKLSV